MTESIKELKKKLEVLHIGAKELKVKLKAAYQRKLISCLHCKKRTKLGNLTYIQTHWHDDQPYADWWVPGEGQFECPKCGKINRNHYNSEIEELRWYFGHSIETYKD